jgi:hypothetical protein
VFTVVRLPGVEPAKLLYLLEPERDPFVLVAPPVRARRWRLRVEALPVVMRTKVEGGRVTVGSARDDDVTWAEFRGFLRDQQTGLDDTRDL